MVCTYQLTAFISQNTCRIRSMRSSSMVTTSVASASAPAVLTANTAIISVQLVMERSLPPSGSRWITTLSAGFSACIWLILAENSLLMSATACGTDCASLSLPDQNTPNGVPMTAAAPPIIKISAMSAPAPPSKPTAARATACPARMTAFLTRSKSFTVLLAICAVFCAVSCMTCCCTRCLALAVTCACALAAACWRAAVSCRPVNNCSRSGFFSFGAVADDFRRLEVRGCSVCLGISALKDGKSTCCSVAAMSACTCVASCFSMIVAVSRRRSVCLLACVCQNLCLARVTCGGSVCTVAEGETPCSFGFVALNLRSNCFCASALPERNAVRLLISAARCSLV